MRIITIRQPYAWAVIHGGKDVENRSRNIAGGYRGPVAIHAGLRFDEAAEDGSPILSTALNAHLDDTDPNCDTLPHQWPWRADIGVIIGVVDLVDVHESLMECMRTPDACNEYNLCSPWAEAYSHHLVLANPRPLAEPIPYRGALGMRNIAVHDPSTTARILAAIA
jgi:hypothetical protein